MPRAIVVILLLVLMPAHVRAEAKIALLIGNETYGSGIGPLANPHNDVALLDATLKGLGFEVTVVRDAGLGALARAVNAYARRLQEAGPDAIGFFYYSGHGASDGSNNYLIPVDANTTEAGALWDESLRLTEITRKLKTEAGNATHFVVFDACRNTLKLTQSGSRAVVQSKGFIPVAQESGMLIAYATAEGELASDVGAGAGPYASALAEEIVRPGVEAVIMFRAVQRRVRAAIHQEPYLGFNALGDVYLAGKGEPSARQVSPQVSNAGDQPSQAIATVLAFEYDTRDGWTLKNIGTEPALDIVVAERSRKATEWTSPVRVPPLGPHEKFVPSWQGHANVDILGATYKSSSGRVFSAICENDLTKIEAGNKIGEWPDDQIGRHWNVKAK